MAEIKLHILKPSVNNLTARIFVRAAGLDFEEVDVWGQTQSPEFLKANPARLTPMLEEEGLPRTTLWESCAIMQYLCNKHGLEQLYPSDPAQRAMVDSAMFYLIGTLYPLVARATYPVLHFPQYPGEVGWSEADEASKAEAQAAAEAALGHPLEVYREFFMDGKRFIGGDASRDRRHPAGGHARVPGRHRLRAAGLGARVHGGDGVGAGRRLRRACRGRARLHRVGEDARVNG